jgi:hypothetical protein
MHRTTIMLPLEVKNAALRKARERGISLGELIRESLQRTLTEGAQQRADDSLFADQACFEGDVENNLAAEHDHYLYDGEEH